MRILPTVSGSSGPRLVRHTGIAAPLRLRTLDPTGSDPSNPDDVEILEEGVFLLKQERYCGASILIADANVGTGPTGAEDSLPGPGIRVLIAPGFGPAFFSEAVRQGILLVPLTVEAIETMADWVEANPRAEMTVDLEAQLITIADLAPIPFVPHPRLRDRLLNGLDDLDELLQHREDAVAFRAEDRNRRPWLYDGGEAALAPLPQARVRRE